jgi:hypothetical protein
VIEREREREMCEDERLRDWNLESNWRRRIASSKESTTNKVEYLLLDRRS